MHGSFGFLSIIPMWLISLFLELVCLGMVLWIRDVTEGMPYNPAYSSFIGIQILIALVLDTKETLLQTAPSGFIATITFQWIVGGIAGIYFLWRLFVYDNPADKYHQLVVMPLLIWLLGTTVPFLWEQGYLQVSAVIISLGVFTGLAMTDAISGRSKPRLYMKTKGVSLKGHWFP